MADEDKGEDVPKSGGGKKLLIIGLLAGLIIGGGGAAGALIMMGGGEHPPEPVPPVKEEPKKDPHFVKVERVTLPVIHKNRILGNAQIDFSLEVDDNDSKMALIRDLPEIRDSLLRHYSVTPIGKEGNPRNIDYAGLKETVKKLSNDVLKNDMVKRVMIVQARYF